MANLSTPHVRKDVATTKSKAHEFAAAVEAAFMYNVQAEVFPDGDNFGVAVVDGAERIGDPLTNKRIETIVLLLIEFSLSNKEIGRTSWLSHVSAGKTPAPIRLGRRVLWLREEISAWLKAGCPNRERWEAMRDKS